MVVGWNELVEGYGTLWSISQQTDNLHLKRNKSVLDYKN